MHTHMYRIQAHMLTRINKRTCTVLEAQDASLRMSSPIELSSKNTLCDTFAYDHHSTPTSGLARYTVS